MTRIAGRYEILRELGRGGMATVHLARQTDLDRLVALKELSSLPSDEPAAAARFLRESRVAGSLSHPNVVTVHDFFEHEGTPFIAMEYLPGGTLRRYSASLGPAQVVGVLLDVLGGLAHAERFGIVHRDLKPENLLVSAEGRVKIADFGIAKAFDRAWGATRLTVTGTTIGTPDYIAPEQAMGHATGPWSDLYSLGCIAFELLVGHPPFADADSSIAVLMRHVNDSVPAVRTVEPTVDPELSAWIGRLVVKDPEERTRSAGRAAGELEDIAFDTLGPRWQSSALLVPDLGDAVPTRPRTTVPLEPWLATTLPPSRIPTGPTEPLPPRRRSGSGGSGRNARRGARGFVWVLALLVAAATVFARVAGGGGAEPGGTPQPAASRAPAAVSATPTPSPTPSPVGQAPAQVSTPAAGARSRRSPARSAVATPSPTQVAAPAQPSCAGDSASDDPSDDACGAGEP
jgi:serine/threonine protein kinase